ncbi:MAG: ATPase [Halioglobus sp.]|nr:ATPase [Halioglobus sp.]
MNAPPEPAAQAAECTCYHCGEPVPPGIDIHVTIDGVDQAMCCPGCQAVAGLICASGLDSFYRQRTAFNERYEPGDKLRRQEFAVYDDPQVAARFCRDSGDRVEAELLVGGMNCAACTWLIERSLSALPGVEQARVNLQQGRLELRYDPAQLRASDIFAHLDALGYSARPFHQAARRELQTEEMRDDLRRLGVAALGMMQVGMFAIALHAGDIQGMQAHYTDLLRWGSLPLATFVVLYSARPFFSTAWRHLRRGALVMDLPVALAIGLAFAASTWATLSGSGQVYFDSVVMFTFFLLLGRYLEKRARMRNDLPWQEAEDTLPAAVPVLRDGQWQSTPRVHLCAGDTILLRAGTAVPVDACVLDGDSAVREDAFSGEHRPRDVAPGDTVFAGTVNLQANLQARALGGYADSRLAALQACVEQAGGHKPALVRLADRVAAGFTAGILLLATATALAWWQIDPQRALWVTLSVLVISCPCALALAMPAALASAAAALRRRGILVRGEDALETLPRCTHLLFDKTGTLTRGELAVARCLPLDALDESRILALAAALQQHSTHPLAAAFLQWRPARNVTAVRQVPGAGLQAQLEGEEWRMGSAAFCREIAPTLPPPPQDELLWVALVRAGVPLAWIGLSDPLRPECAAVTGRARQWGLALELLTGDSSARASRLAAQLGFDSVRVGQSPQQKEQRVAQLQAGGAQVCMIGDGLNDAPVLARADTSMAVAGATDLARTQADFVILRGGLDKVLEALQLTRRCRRVVWQNIAWALTYNACAIPLAAMGLVPPWAAALGMSLSSLLVVANSLRLNTGKPGGS